MKKSLKFITLGVCTFALGLSISNFAMSDVSGYKIGVVDVQKVVASSSQVKALKDEQQTKVKNVKAFVESARKAVNAESDATKKKALENKYNKELQTKTADIEKEYAQKLKTIDTNISGVIKKQAQDKNYNIVLAKGVVLYGGEDITEDIIKATK